MKIGSLDIDNFYPNVSHSRIADKLGKILEDRDKIEKDHIPTKCILEATNISLKYHICEFNGELYSQDDGSSMGNQASPDICDLAIVDIDEKIQQLGKKHIFWYGRYRDDILVLWDGSERQFDSFLTKVNAIDPTKQIQFKTEFGYDPKLSGISKKQRNTAKTTLNLDPRDNGKMLSFLDIDLLITENGIKTRSHYKPTNTHDYLLPSSMHQQSVFKGNIHTLFHSVRIHTDDEFLDIEMNKMASWLINRNYDPEQVKNIQNKYQSLSKNECLKINLNYNRYTSQYNYNNWWYKKTQKNSTLIDLDNENQTKNKNTNVNDFHKIIISLLFHPSINKTRMLSILNKYYPIMSSDSILSKIFPTSAKDCFELRYRGDTPIGRRIAPPTNLPPENNNQQNNTKPKGMTMCNRPKCYICERKFNLVSRDKQWKCATTN